MTRGTILKAIRKDNRDMLVAASVLATIVAGVLLLNWKYMYNWAAGPFRFDAALAAHPGAREFVRAEGPLLPTGMVQETTYALLRGALQTKSVTADYMVLLAGDRFLVTKVKPEFSGKVVEGRLLPMPEKLRASLVSEARSGDKLFHPYLLEQKSYRYDANPFVMIATPSLPFALLLLVAMSWRALRLERHPAIRRLRKRGPYRAVVDGIERDLAAAGATARVGPLWVTPEWLVSVGASVFIYHADDLVGAGLRTSTTNKSGPKHTLHFWPKGKIIADAVEVSASEARLVLAALAERMPWVPKEDVDVFEKRWNQDREACAREAEAQRSALRQAAVPQMA